MLLILLILLIPTLADATVWTAADFPTLKKILTQVQPGDTVQLAGSVWQHPMDTTRDYLTLAVSGTAAAPITLTAAPGAKPILTGRGFEDKDLDGNGMADGPRGTTNEALIRVTGNYWVISALRVTQSNRWGIYLQSDHVTVDGCETDNNWDAGVTVDGNFNAVLHVNSHHNRHMSGLVIRPGTTARTANTNTISGNFSHDNGYLPDGTVVLPAIGDPNGGGNADGLTAFKGCSDDAPAAGQNLCLNNTVTNNVFQHNADDGCDTSFADSVVADNTSINNSAPGNGPNGFKVLRTVKNVQFLHNVSYFDLDGFSLRIQGGRVEGNVVQATRRGMGFDLKYPSTLAAVSQNLAIKTAGVGFHYDEPCAVCVNNWSTDNTGDHVLPQ